MNTRKIFGCGMQSLFCAIAVIITLTGCPADTAPAHIHDWQWVETTPATTTADGLETETCTTCGATNGTRPIAKLPKANPTVTWPTGLTALHGKTLSAISLASYTNSGGTPGAFSWTTPTSSVGALGTRSHNMTFTPTDTANYNTAAKDVNVFVSLSEMVRVAGGTFTMGSPDTQDWNADPPHTVTLTQGFYMGKYEVTQKEYETVMGSLPSSLTDGTYGKGDDYPVYYVSWYDALVFCNKLSALEGLTSAYSIDGKTDPDEWGTVPTSSDATWNAVEIVANSTGYRLPTEAQWEYACRAGTTTPWHSGATDDTLDDYAWHWDNIPSQTSGETGYGTQPVGTKQANDFGLYDMHGNVWEWCWDRFGTYTEEAQTDPEGASSGSFRVERGGSWSYSAEYVRSAFRNDYGPNRRVINLGFRVLRP